MKKRILVIILVCFFGILLITGAVVLGLDTYYKRSFAVNTWINGVYCTGKNVDEVNSEFVSEMSIPQITIIDKDGNRYPLNMSDMEYSEDYRDSLLKCFGHNQLQGWYQSFSKENNYEIVPYITWDEDKLYDFFCELPFVKDEITRDKVVKIVLTDMGYSLYEGTKECLDVEKAYLAIIDAVHQKKDEVRIDSEGFYNDLPETSADEDIRELWNKVNSFIQSRIVYDMGDKLLPIDEKIMSDFIALDSNSNFLMDENGQLLLDSIKVQQFIHELANAYDTEGTECEFQATRGDIVKVPYVNYGTRLDKEKEVLYLTNAILTQKQETHIPSYKRVGYVRGVNDIGNTYIEIDISTQKLYVYRDGLCLIETDVVTGNEEKEMGTPIGVNHVYGKYRQCILRGEDYESYVEYWMPVVGGIGIHDASWRNTFGDEIYLHNGSHGCINVPKEIMPEIYNSCEQGTPVIIVH